MSGVTDWTDLGVFPLQDHDKGIPIETRQALTGVRVSKLTDPSEAGGPDDTVLEYAKENGLGTIGDVHPWAFWQTEDREKRGMGSWSMAWSGIVVGGNEDRRVSAARIQPFRGTAEDSAGGTAPITPGSGGQIRLGEPLSDPRYATKTPEWTPALGVLPRGTMAIVLPGTEESTQADVMYRADPRLVAPNVSGPGEAGTLVVDLQPFGELCMGGSVVPGVGGRHARLQSLIRVVAMPSGDAAGGGPTTGPKDVVGSKLSDLNIKGNLLALQYGQAASDGHGSFGAVFGRAAGSGGTGSVTALDRIDIDTPKSVAEFGKFEQSATPGHGVGLMAAIGGGGPIIIPGKDDKHNIGEDADGNPIGSAHISAGAMYYFDRAKDGPLHFEGQYPGEPDPLPGIGAVHLTFDGGKPHNWLGSTKNGLWRWYCEVPYVYPTTPGGTGTGGTTTPGGGEPPGPGGTPGGTPGPTTPGGGTPPGPTTPGPGGTPPGPTTPGPGGTPGPTTPGGGTGPGFPGPGSIPGPLTPGGTRPPRPPDPIPIPAPGAVPPPDPAGGGPGTGGGGPITPGGTPGRINPPGPRIIPGATPPPEPGTGPRSGGEGIRGILSSTVTQVERVGEAQPTDVGLYSILHPIQEAFSSIAFRPQKWVLDQPNYEHSPSVDREAVQEDERTRPQVAILRAWGAQTASGEWDYLERPEISRARGGIAKGGIIFGPPGLEMEDYLGLGSVDVRGQSSFSYLTAAPGAGFALGTPKTDAGGLLSKSVALEQDLSDSNEPLRVCQVNSSGTATDILRAELNQSTGEVRVVASGSGAIIIPRGGDADRPSGAWSGASGSLRISSEGASDVLEMYDAQGATWSTVGGGGGGGEDHGGLTGLGDDDHTQYLLVDGTRAMTGALAMGSNKITGVTAGTLSGEVATVDNLTPYALKAGAVITGDYQWQDNDEIQLGTGQDSRLYYDGTNTIWNPKAAGSGHIEIQGDLLFADNNEIFFGTGKDASILYNGTNLIIDSALVGSGKTVFRTHVIMQDNVDLWLGNSGDGRMGFDGTDVFMDPNAVGSGKFRVGGDVRCDGTYYHGTTAGTTNSISFVDGDGNTIEIDASGGMVSVLTKTAP